MIDELVVMTDEWDGDKHKVYRTPVNDNDNIPRSGILFMVISCEDTVRPRLNGRRRLCEAHGKDWYTLIVRGQHVMLPGWDDGDLVWYNLDNPWAEETRVIPDHIPMAHGITFKGKRIPDDEWLQAIDQFMAEMH